MPLTIDHTYLCLWSHVCCRALEEKKRAMALAEEERRKRALEERRRAQKEATERFKSAISRLRSASSKPKRGKGEEMNLESEF